MSGSVVSLLLRQIKRVIGTETKILSFAVGSTPVAHIERIAIFLREV